MFAIENYEDFMHIAQTAGDDLFLGIEQPSSDDETAVSDGGVGPDDDVDHDFTPSDAHPDYVQINSSTLTLALD